MLLSTFAFALMGVLVKELTEMHAMQILFVRATVAMSLLIPYMLSKDISILGNKRRLLVIRAIFGTASIATFFFVLQRIPLGSSVSLRFLGPIFGTLFAVYFLKEKVSKGQWLCFAIAFSGVIMIKGFDARIDHLSFVLVMSSAIFLGLAIIMVRYLTASEHFTTIILYFMAGSMITSLLFIQYWRWPIGVEWYALSGVAIMGILGQIFFTNGLKTEETNVAAPLKYLELAWVLIIGFFFFDETYGWIPFAGIILIVVGMVMNVIIKERARKKVANSQLVK